MDDLTFTDNTQAHRFEVRKGDTLAAIADYVLEPAGSIRLTHTEVLPGFEGQGMGSKIAKGTLEAVRARGLQALPECEFMAGYLKKNAATYPEVLGDETRRMLGI